MMLGIVIMYEWGGGFMFEWGNCLFLHARNRLIMGRKLSKITGKR